MLTIISSVPHTESVFGPRTGPDFLTKSQILLSVSVSLCSVCLLINVLIRREKLMQKHNKQNKTSRDLLTEVHL